MRRSGWIYLSLLGVGLLCVPAVSAGILGGLRVPTYPATQSPALLMRSSGAFTASVTGWPMPSQLIEVALLKNYNTRLVVLSTTVLGLAAGLVGSFLLLRKRSLMGDALSHACLPGIGLAFLVMVWLGGSGKSLPALLCGATISGCAGVALVLWIHKNTRIKDDAAMGIVLSVFFGAGVALLGMIQTLPGASAAGLENFIYGKTASMVMRDFVLICMVAGLVAGLCVLLFKELTLLCFDEGFATSQGWPVVGLDVLMLALVAAVTVVGLQAVGLILIIAFLIIPAAAARFWTHDVRRMVLLAGGIGAVSGWLGASLSALTPRMPAGAVIVLVAAAVFLVSMLLGTSRGVLRLLLADRQLRRKVGRQNLLRAAYEILESRGTGEGVHMINLPFGFDELLQRRSWSAGQLRRLIAVGRREDHVERFDGRILQLSESGLGEAARITRNHRLWETYLIQHADVAPAHVDRDADAVEHVLGAELVRELELELARRGQSQVPPSPHAIQGAGRVARSGATDASAGPRSEK